MTEDTPGKPGKRPIRRRKRSKPTNGISVWVTRVKGRKNLILQYFDPITNKRKSVSANTDNEDAAQIEAGILEEKLNTGAYTPASKISWKQFREIYENEKLSGDGEKNRSKAATVFDLFETVVSAKTADGINERTVSAFITAMRKRGLKPTTIKGYLTYLKAALRWAHDQKIIRTVPTFTMPKIPKGTNRAKIQKASRMTGENLDRMIEVCPNRGWQLLLAFAWHCGMRREEVVRIRGEHIDLDRHTVSIPKNKAGDISAKAVLTPELDAFLRQRFPDGIPDGPLVRGLPENLSLVSLRFVSDVSKKALVVGNSREGYATLHDLRRNFGSRWARKVPAQILRQMMRHSSISTTLEYYAETENAAIELIWQPSSITNTATYTKSEESQIR